MDEGLPRGGAGGSNGYPDQVRRKPTNKGQQIILDLSSLSQLRPTFGFWGGPRKARGSDRI